MYEYETNKKIPRLSDVRRKEREEKEKKFDIEAKELLLKAIEFYNKNYPKTEHDKIYDKSKIKLSIGKKDLNVELKKLEEKELIGIKDCLIYFHDERQMPSIVDHDRRTRVNGKLNNLIPGATYINKLNKLYEQRHVINKQIETLEDQLKVDRNKFAKKFSKDVIKEKITCKICGRSFRSNAGLTSHMKTHDKKD